MEYNSEIKSAAKERVATVALKHLKQIDARTLTVFHRNQVFKDMKRDDPLECILPILKDPNHPDRVSVSGGPLFFHLGKGEKQGTRVLYVADLFFSEYVKLRTAALDYFEKMFEEFPPLLTAKTKDIIQKRAEHLKSDDEQNWRDSAVAIYDAIKNDWYCNYAAVKQCLERNFDKGVENFLTQVVRPTISSVDTVDVGIWATSEQKQLVESEIVKIARETRNIDNALNKYLVRFGHLPLTKSLSISRLLEEWQKQNSKIGNLWDTIWSWADRIDHPLPRYHACMFFNVHPGFIPKGRHQKLWQEITEIIHLPNDEEDDLCWTQSWRMLCELARHYCCHLESRLPWKDGERIASQALWLAVRVSMLFPSAKEEVKHLREITFLPELATSSRVWQITSPAIKPSELRFLTINIKSIWSLSLLAQLGDNFGALKPETIQKEDWERIEQALSGSIVGTFPPVPKEEAKVNYAFGDSLLKTGKQWVKYLKENKENKEMINAFIVGVEKLTKTEDFEKNLRKLPNVHQGDQLLIAHHFKNSVFTEEVPLDAIWNCLNDSLWREAAFRKSHPIVLVLVFDALNEIQTRYQEKWSYHLPHFYAVECENVIDNKERLQHLFAYTIRSSVCADSISAIQRLLLGKYKTEFLEEVEYWQKHLSQIQKWAPEWVKGRLRAVLATLHI